MVTVVERIFLCTDVMFLINQKKLDFSLSLCPKYAHFLYIIIQDSEIKNQRNQQQEWLYLMN
jgi:hypothetical protein